MFRSSLPEAEAAYLRIRHPCSNTMQQHLAATPCTYRRISSINASFYLICIDVTPCEREKLCISIVFKHLTYAYRANFSRTANKLIEAQLSGSQQRASHGAMPRTASRKCQNKGVGQEALGPESQRVEQEALGPSRYRVQRSQIRRSAGSESAGSSRRHGADSESRGAVAATVSTPRARGRYCHHSDGSEGPGWRAHTTSDAEQTDAVAARISSRPVARRA